MLLKHFNKKRCVVKPNHNGYFRYRPVRVFIEHHKASLHPDGGDEIFGGLTGDAFDGRAGSPAIDAAIKIDKTVTKDYKGTLVPQNKIPDIGAFEYKK